MSSKLAWTSQAVSNNTQQTNNSPLSQMTTQKMEALLARILNAQVKNFKAHGVIEMPRQLRALTELAEDLGFNPT